MVVQSMPDIKYPIVMRSCHFYVNIWSLVAQDNYFICKLLDSVFFFSMGAALSKVRFFMLQGAQWKKLTWIGED